MFLPFYATNVLKIRTGCLLTELEYTVRGIEEFVRIHYLQVRDYLLVMTSPKPHKIMPIFSD